MIQERLDPIRAELVQRPLHFAVSGRPRPLECCSLDRPGWVIQFGDHDRGFVGKIESAINEVKEALKGGEASAIKSASDKLNEAWQAVSAELYKAAAEKTRAGKAKGQPGGGEAKEEAGKKDEGPIIDAEVVDEKK